MRAEHFRKEIENTLTPSSARIRLGLTLIVYGLAKKLVIADNVAIHVDSIFIDGEHLQNIGLIWWGALAFGIQIYCDFSAYTDIAIGSAQFGYPRILNHLMRLIPLKTFGAAGTSPSQPGYVIISTYPWAVVDTENV